MHQVAFLLKTFRGDLAYAERLLRSYLRHNRDGIPMYIVTPATDAQVFRPLLTTGIELLTDESVAGDDIVSDTSVRGIRPGYINQEIVKLNFWRQGITRNYMCLDSDGEFIRDFFVADLMFDADTPFTILAEDNELAVDPEYYRTYWPERERQLRLIQRELGLTDRRVLTSHGFSILSSAVLHSLHENFMMPRGLAYKDLLALAPYEFSWYNMWLQKDRTIRLESREPIFKTFHHQYQHLDYVSRGIRIGDIARGYIGVVIDSGYSRNHGVISYLDADEYEPSAEYLRLMSAHLARAFRQKARWKLRELAAALGPRRRPEHE